MATSNITNTILDPSGGAVAGVLVRATLMPGPGFREDTFSEVARSVETTSSALGAWTLPLERNTNISPENTYYIIDEFIPQGKGGPTRYIIQVGASNQPVMSALVNPNPTLDPTLYLTQAAGDVRYAAALAFGDIPDVMTPDQASAQGVSGNAARGDHVHGMPTDVPSVLAISPSEGVSTSFSRADHIHPLPSRLGWHLTRVATQSLTADTPTNISWDTEVQDIPGNFTPHATTGTTITIPTNGDGLWLISVYLEASAPCADRFELQITAGGFVIQVDDADDINAGPSLVLTYAVPLVATNTIVVNAEVGDTRTVTGRFTAYRIGI